MGVVGMIAGMDIGATVFITLLVICTAAAHRRFLDNEVTTCNEMVTAVQGRDNVWLGLNGTLSSPRFPHSYPAGIQCRINLTAPATHRVRLVFTHFYLYHPLNESTGNCEPVDSLSVFEGVSANITKMGVFCGPSLPRPILSSGPYLTLKFRSYTSGQGVTGYRVNYAFVSDYGMAAGRQLDSNKCIFQFDSTVAAIGVVTSPNPGGYYPRNTECRYVFRGQQFEAVRLHFNFFDVEGIAPCSAASRSDVVEFNDGPGPYAYTARRCGHFGPNIVESSGQHFQITFRSNDVFNGLGFEANYTFFSKGRSHPQPPLPPAPHSNTVSLLWSSTALCVISLAVATSSHHHTTP